MTYQRTALLDVIPFLIVLLLSVPAFAQVDPCNPPDPPCWTTGSESLVGWCAATGPVEGYHVYLDGVLTTSTTGSTQAVVYCEPSTDPVVTVAPYNATEIGPLSVPSAPLDCSGPGKDLDGNGIINAKDLTQWRRSFAQGCVSPAFYAAP